MEISIEELNALSDRTGAMQVRIAELERALSEQKAEYTPEPSLLCFEGCKGKVANVCRRYTSTLF